MSGSFFGRYQLLELIGEGGMGQVYRAYDPATDRVVALKVLPPHASDDEKFQQRFRREAHTAAGLTDPHVVPIHGYGEVDGHLFLDMRLIEGRDLGVILRQNIQLDPLQAVDYVEQVAEALTAAHAAGLVHRDVKPSNILITPRDFVYLIDFGIAHAANATRITSTGYAIGTFAYMAPERVKGEQAGPRSDIYALACVLYESLTGQVPFGGDSVDQQLAGHVMRPPPRPSEASRAVPVSFDAVIEKGLAKNPDARYQTALDLADAAREALNARPRSPQPVVQPPTQTAEVARSAPHPVTPQSSTRPAAVVRPHHVDAVHEPSAGQGGRWGKVALWSLILGILVAIVIGVVVAFSFGTRSTIKPDGAAKSVTDLVSQQTGFKPTDVNCPSGEEAKVGVEFDCHFTGPDGPYTAHMKVTKVDGSDVVFDIKTQRI